ncbi:MAG: SDR family oxidoreductase [Polyangiaceae bacterium]
MSLEKKNVVIVGAAGVVGSGVVRKFLDAGATVVGVSRKAENLAKVRETVKIGAGEPFLGVVADFKDEGTAEAAGKAVLASLGGQAIDHVVSVQGFVIPAKDPTQCSAESVETALREGLINNFLAAKTFLPAMKGREGSSFTLVSGGLAHIPPPVTAVWLGTLKNAALNAFQFALTAETAKDKVRVNTVCIHFGVAPVGGTKNQLGMDTEDDTLRLAPAFVAIARGTQKGQLLCLSSFADADKLAGVPSA